MNWRQNQVDYGVQSGDKPWQEACENYINLQFLHFLPLRQRGGVHLDRIDSTQSFSPSIELSLNKYHNLIIKNSRQRLPVRLLVGNVYMGFICRAHILEAFGGDDVIVSRDVNV